MLTTWKNKHNKPSLSNQFTHSSLLLCGRELYHLDPNNTWIFSGCFNRITSQNDRLEGTSGDHALHGDGVRHSWSRQSSQVSLGMDLTRRSQENWQVPVAESMHNFGWQKIGIGKPQDAGQGQGRGCTSHPAVVVLWPPTLSSISALEMEVHLCSGCSVPRCHRLLLMEVSIFDESTQSSSFQRYMGSSEGRAKLGGKGESSESCQAT